MKGRAEKKRGKGAPEPEPPCRGCRWWDPKVLSDSCGIIRGVCYCSRERAEGFSCFEPPPEKEDEKE